MRYYRVKKSSLSGEMMVPPSKSQTLRAILFAALAHGKSTIHHYLPSPDAFAMIDACRLFGAIITVFPERIEIVGTGGKICFAEDVIHAGNSGIVLRFCAAVGALSCYPIFITGDHSIRHQRPMQPLLEGLSQLGVATSSTRGDGYAPIIIQGPIKPGNAVIVGEDSQYVSALLIAGAFAEGPIQLNVRQPGEKPWINLTLDWLKRLGIPYKNEEFCEYHLFGNAKYEGFEYKVPGDLSSAAFPIAAALVTQSELTLKNVDMNDLQGDKELIRVFEKMGACMQIEEHLRMLHVKKGKALSGLSIDINDFIDGITVLAVVACFAEGETHIKNAAVAKHKECNRIRCIVTELRKMGADIQETEDGLIVKKSELQGTGLHSYNDHRMAMSLTVAALNAQGDSTVRPVECVSKTFPAFAHDFTALGANIMEFA